MSTMKNRAKTKHRKKLDVAKLKKFLTTGSGAPNISGVWSRPLALKSEITVRPLG